jgi:hypothetical protein
METLSKSKIIAKFTWAINHDECFQGDYIEAKTRKTIRFTIEIKDPEIYTDEKGCKWVRA